MSKKIIFKFVHIFILVYLLLFTRISEQSILTNSAINAEPDFTSIATMLATGSVLTRMASCTPMTPDIALATAGGVTYLAGEIDKMLNYEEESKNAENYGPNNNTQLDTLEQMKKKGKTNQETAERGEAIQLAAGSLLATAATMAGGTYALQQSLNTQCMTGKISVIAMAIFNFGIGMLKVFEKFALSALFAMISEAFAALSAALAEELNYGGAAAAAAASILFALKSAHEFLLATIGEAANILSLGAQTASAAVGVAMSALVETFITDPFCPEATSCISQVLTYFGIMDLIELINSGIQKLACEASDLVPCALTTPTEIYDSQVCEPAARLIEATTVSCPGVMAEAFYKKQDPIFKNLEKKFSSKKREKKLEPKQSIIKIFSYMANQLIREAEAGAIDSILKFAPAAIILYFTLDGSISEYASHYLTKASGRALMFAAMSGFAFMAASTNAENASRIADQNSKLDIIIDNFKTFNDETQKPKDFTEEKIDKDLSGNDTNNSKTKLPENDKPETPKTYKGLDLSSSSNDTTTVSSNTFKDLDTSEVQNDVLKNNQSCPTNSCSLKSQGVQNIDLNSDDFKGAFQNNQVPTAVSNTINASSSIIKNNSSSISTIISGQTLQKLALAATDFLDEKNNVFDKLNVEYTEKDGKKVSFKDKAKSFSNNLLAITSKVLRENPEGASLMASKMGYRYNPGKNFDYDFNFKKFEFKKLELPQFKKYNFSGRDIPFNPNKNKNDSLNKDFEDFYGDKINNDKIYLKKSFKDHDYLNESDANLFIIITKRYQKQEIFLDQFSKKVK